MIDNSIRKEISSRQITRLCHFTRSSKLLHILRSETGVLATHFLEILHEDILCPTDEYRYDDHKEYICCSIQYPNTWYLDRVRNKDPIFNEWVIIFINPLVMLNPATRFCHRNAAADRGAHICSGLDGFRGIFGNPVQGKTLLYRTPKMMDCCPTDGQAEVLIHESIPRDEILAIAVPTFEQARVEIERYKHIPEAPKVKWIVAPDIFNNNWSIMIKKGLAPEELPYE